MKCSKQLAWSDQFASDEEAEYEYGRYLWQLMIVAALNESAEGRPITPHNPYL